MGAFLAVLGIMIGIVIIIEIWPLLLAIAIIAPIAYGIHTYAKNRQEEEAQFIALRAEQLRQKEAEWQATQNSIADEINTKLPIISRGNINTTGSYIRTLNRKAKEYAISVAHSKINDIEKYLNEAMGKGKLSDAMNAVEFLLLLTPNNNEYRKVENAICSMESIMYSDSVYICSDNYGKINMDLVNRIKQQDTNTFGQLTDVDVRYVLWTYTLSDSFCKHSYKSVSSMFTRVEQSPHIQLDYIASLIYLEARFGNNEVNQIMPHYRECLSKIKNLRSTTAIASLASVAAWCENTERERVLRSLLCKRKGIPQSNHEPAASRRAYA